jgi:hypothetical protein
VDRLGIVTLIWLVCSVVGAVLLAVLFVSLRAQGDDTDKQAWNRRMLTTGSLTWFGGLVLPFVLLPVSSAAALSIGTVVLGFVATGLVVFGRARRIITILCFLSAAVVVGLDPHSRDLRDATVILIGGGLTLALLSGAVEKVRPRRKQHQ